MHMNQPINPALARFLSGGNDFSPSASDMEAKQSGTAQEASAVVGSGLSQPPVVVGGKHLLGGGTQQSMRILRWINVVGYTMLLILGTVLVAMSFENWATFQVPEIRMYYLEHSCASDVLEQWQRPWHPLQPSIAVPTANVCSIADQVGLMTHRKPDNDAPNGWSCIGVYRLQEWRTSTPFHLVQWAFLCASVIGVYIHAWAASHVLEPILFGDAICTAQPVFWRAPARYLAYHYYMMRDNAFHVLFYDLLVSTTALLLVLGAVTVQLTLVVVPIIALYDVYTLTGMVATILGCSPLLDGTGCKQKNGMLLFTHTILWAAFSASVGYIFWMETLPCEPDRTAVTILFVGPLLLTWVVNVTTAGARGNWAHEKRLGYWTATEPLPDARLYRFEFGTNVKVDIFQQDIDKEIETAKTRGEQPAHALSTYDSQGAVISVPDDRADSQQMKAIIAWKKPPSENAHLLNEEPAAEETVRSERLDAFYRLQQKAVKWALTQSVLNFILLGCTVVAWIILGTEHHTQP